MVGRARLAIPVLATALAIPVGGRAEFQVNTYTTGDQRAPAVARDGTGNYIVVWTSEGEDGDATGVFGRRFDATGAPLGGEFQVNAYTTSYQYAPSVAADASGNFVVVWSSYYQDGSSTGIMGRRFDATGAPLGGEFQVPTYTTYEQLQPAVAAAADGSFIVVWDRYGPGDDFGVWGRRFDAAGAPLGSQFQVDTDTSYEVMRPAVASAPGGEFVVAWESYNFLDGLAARLYDDTGTPAGTDFDVRGTPEYQPYGPSVSMDASGAFVVVWHAYGDGDGCCSGIFGRRFDADGTPLGDDFVVNTYTPGYQTFPSVSREPGGDFVVVWVDDTQEDFLNYGVYGRRFDADGAPLGGEFHVNTYTAGRQGGGDYRYGGPAVAAGPGGEFLVVWESEAQDGNGYGVFAQRFGSATTSSTSTTTTTTLPSSPHPVSGSRLLILDRGAPSERRLVFVSKDPSLDTTVGTGADPVADGASLQVYRASGTGDVACFPLTTGGGAAWTARDDAARPTFQYEDLAAVNGPCRRAALRDGKLLKVVCRATVQPIPYSLDEQLQLSVAVRFRSGATEYCTVFGGTIVRDVQGARFGARDAPAPAVCPPAPSACP